MMLHKKSQTSHLLKLLALVPIVGVTIALNAKTVQDVVYTEAPEATSIEEFVNEEFQQAEPQPAEAEVAKDDEDKKFVAEGIVFDASGDQGSISQFDENNYSPIVGAIVKVVGTKKGTVTGPDGKFKLEVSDGDHLEAMYIGYESVKIFVNKAFSEAGNKYPMPLRKEGATESADSNPNKVYDDVDEMPQFPGGPSKLFEFLAKNVGYPAEAEKAGTQGRVIATFVVEKDGSISNAKVVKSVDPLLDAEALRVINGMPNWNPGKQNGELVRVKYAMPISFALQGGSTIPANTEKGANVMDETVVVGYGGNDSNLLSETKKIVVKTIDDAPLKLGLSNDKGIVYVVNGKLITDSKKIEVQTDEIEKIQVLKNKEAVEKYGEKAKNGVIVITTKK